MSELRTLVYVSTATRLLGDDELAALLTEARRRNLEHGITGVLLYCEGSFMQCLEGPPASLRDVFRRIEASSQHKDLIELFDEPIAERSFRDWQMGFSKIEQADAMALSAAAWDGSSAASGNAVPTGMQLLRDFWDRCRR
ncbi:MAG: BLUF domain-containing protein [Burkholderiales bacterium]|nr:BLUF domain-containing protein [Burkholderiales bacterium]